VSGLRTTYLKFFGFNPGPLLNNYHCAGKICFAYLFRATQIKKE